MNDPAYTSTRHASLGEADIDVSQDGGGTVEDARLKEDVKKCARDKGGKL